MTTPGVITGPNGAFTWGGRFGQDVTQAAVINAATGGVKTKYSEAQDNLHLVTGSLQELGEQIRDGQVEMNDRLDLLEAVEGYCSLYMSYNWNVAGGHFVKLPFDAVLGPNKGAVLYNNGIRLQGKGLWRSDAHVTFKQPPSDWFTNGTVAAQLYLSVCAVGNDSVFSEHEFDIVITPQGAETASFSHTFVVPTDDAFYVRVGVAHPKASAWIYGGTARSSLSVNKWDNGTVHAEVVPVAPDGGALS
ncbi:hypothetical protein [Antrihabitans cavernicola]|uniref:Uncharacterized protein n=1 Tax=Antrihabitans cavernicola TaxID=2495913 RepID=A0A5A7S6S6_9NOCA|nr:hypothetical protein [Spelaeibacter cavernicola]KAA0016755.1 hypothetical protein FOY51_25755 [Spelaeibacter cavernicola]